MPTKTLKNQAAQKTNSPAPQVSALRWRGGKSQEESNKAKTPNPTYCSWNYWSGATRKLTAMTKATRPLARLFMSIRNSIWKWACSMFNVHFQILLRRYFDLGQTTASIEGWRWCGNPRQCWHQAGSLYQWGRHHHCGILTIKPNFAVPHLYDLVKYQICEKGWGNFWDSAEHWSAVEGSTAAGFDETSLNLKHALKTESIMQWLI